MIFKNVSIPGWKSGGVPYHVSSNGVYVCLVSSTNPLYGGTDPAIPKGRPDFNETPKQTAMREIKEETGITISNIEYLNTQHVTGLTRSYDLHIYTIRLKYLVNLKGNYEVVPKWYHINEAEKLIRRSHYPFLKLLLEKIRK